MEANNGDEITPFKCYDGVLRFFEGMPFFETKHGFGPIPFGDLEPNMTHPFPDGTQRFLHPEGRRIKVVVYFCPDGQPFPVQ